MLDDLGGQHVHLDIGPRDARRSTSNTFSGPPSWLATMMPLTCSITGMGALRACDAAWVDTAGRIDGAQ
jgi:hypothetical protein